MAVTTHKGNLPHIEWIDLKTNGVLVECAVLKRDHFNNIYFFEVGKLDNIDKKRLMRVLSNRNAVSLELWDLMSQITLNNGVNALTYFHQLVRIITPEGIIMNPKQGVVGSGMKSGQVNTQNVEQMTAINMSGQKLEANTSMPTADANTLLQSSKPKAKS